VLSKEKDKISKSQGNNPTDPEQLIKQYPADAIRYWTASGHLGHDVAFSETQLKIGQKLITKLWNAFRFLQEHMHDAPTKQPQDLGLLNTWLLHQAHTAYTTYSKQLDLNEFGPALVAVEQFFWNDFCDNYLELIKDQLFHSELYAPETVAATKWTLHHVGLRLLQLLAPYIPHSTDTLYSMFYKEKTGIASLHITAFKALQMPVHAPETVAPVTFLLDVISAVRKLKTAQELSLKTPLHTLTITGITVEAYNVIKEHEQYIYGTTFSNSMTLTTEICNTNSIEQKNNAWYATIKCPSIEEK
jgi:valyl-tRNA synthetase